VNFKFTPQTQAGQKGETMKVYNVSNDEFFAFLTAVCDKHFITLADDLYGDWSVEWLCRCCYDGKTGCGIVDLKIHYQKHESKIYVGFEQHRTQRKFFCVYDAEKHILKVVQSQTNIQINKCFKKLKRVLEVKF
jgi:hypothetical protein